MSSKALLLLFFLIPFNVDAQTFMVNSPGDCVDQIPGDGICDDGDGDCTLRAAIEEANALPGMQTIRFGVGNVNLINMLPPLNSDITIQGPGSDLLIVSGNNSSRIFFAKSGMIVINDLTLANGLAQGGNGAQGGGGGMGAGGALLMHEGKVGFLDVQINNVIFENNQAIGGAGNNSNYGPGGGGGMGGMGGNGSSGTGGGGGGGFLGDGGSGRNGGGGGGGGFLEDGQDGQDLNKDVGGNGGLGSGGGGGGYNDGLFASGGLSFFIGEDPGQDGKNAFGGDGGFGGGGGGENANDNNGGNGGFGGGGGGAIIAGDGGFGGGGGGSYGYFAGSGGFGGGGGAGGEDYVGPGGFGAGEGDTDGNGGGGLGAGGAVFVVSGSLTMANVEFNNNSTMAGAGGDTDNGGQALGGAIFVFNGRINDSNGPDGKDNARVIIEPGCGLTFNGNAAPDNAMAVFSGDGTTINDNNDILGPITGDIAPNNPDCTTLLPIPTIGQWGILLLALLFLTMGLSVLSSQRMIIIGQNGSITRNYSMFFRLIPADKLKNYFKPIVALAVITGICIFLIWGEVTALDILGIAVVVPLIVNLVYILSHKE
jgi:CSLREA domain-containing protein